MLTPHDESAPVASDAPLSSIPGLWPLVFASGTAQFMMPFMVGGLNPMLPAIGHDLHGSAVELGLIGAVYALSLTVFHLLAGRMGDILGRRRLFLIGLSIFLGCTAILPLTPAMPPFLVLRFVMAVGTAMMNTSALSILMDFAPGSMRGRVLGISTAGVFLGVSFGPITGGLVASMLGWRWLFYLLLPVGCTAWFMMAFWVRGEWKNAPDMPFDWTGALAWLVGMTALACGLMWLLHGGWAYAALGAGVIFLAVFVGAELRAARRGVMPILDLDMALRNTSFLANSVIAFINYSTVLGPLFYFSLYLQFVHGLDMKSTGLFLGLQPLVQLLLVPHTGRLVDRYGSLKIMVLGLFLCSVGLCIASLLTSASPLLQVACSMVVMGVGLACFGPGSTTAIMSSVDSAHMSQASGVVGTMRTLGMLISMLTVSLTVNYFLGDAPMSVEMAPAFMLSMRTGIGFANMLNLLALGLALWLLLTQKRHKKAA